VHLEEICSPINGSLLNHLVIADMLVVITSVFEMSTRGLSLPGSSGRYGAGLFLSDSFVAVKEPEKGEWCPDETPMVLSGHPCGRILGRVISQRRGGEVQKRYNFYHAHHFPTSVAHNRQVNDSQRVHDIPAPGNRPISRRAYHFIHANVATNPQ
jgi:hypothetical protein